MYAGIRLQERWTFQELKTDYDQARTEWGRQYEAIDKIKSQLDSEENSNGIGTKT